eukprot:2749721-Alexandrium_andersonii.AAC.1
MVFAGTDGAKARFEQNRLDPCLFLLRDEARELRGGLRAHVDDLLLGDDSAYQGVADQLAT